MLANQFSTAKITNSSRKNVLIVGGGPGGLAAALMLAKRGWTEITVLEKRPTADYYEPDKSYNYLIDGRGQKFTDFLEITEKLAEISVPNTEFYLTQIKSDGSRKTAKIPQVNPNRKTAYWLPRREFVLLLYEEIQRNWQDKITVLFDINCDRIDKTEVNRLKIVATENGRIIEFDPDFLIGCDGVNSIVRNTLQEWDKSDKFEMKHFPSHSSGLKYKVLNLPPSFPLDNSGGERAVCDMAYAIRSSFRDRKRSISLGLLPFKNSKEPRTANIITRPDHEIWKLKSGEQICDFLTKAFPQLSVRQIVSPEECDRFVKSEGGYFPEPQFCFGLYFLLGQEQAKDRSTTGVVLLGDAIHCFPPDIGQGVNSALEDVCILNEALSQSNDDLSRALPLFESLRFRDVKALIYLAQTAFPWQYNQDNLGKWLWGINFFARLLLNKLLPFGFSPPAFFLIQNHQLSYREIWVMAQRTTRTLYAIALLLFCVFSTLILKQVGF